MASSNTSVDRVLKRLNKRLNYPVPSSLASTSAG
jgi:hypothetical protein